MAMDLPAISTRQEMRIIQDADDVHTTLLEFLPSVFAFGFWLWLWLLLLFRLIRSVDCTICLITLKRLAASTEHKLDLFFHLPPSCRSISSTTGHSHRGLDGRDGRNRVLVTKESVDSREGGERLEA